MATLPEKLTQNILPSLEYLNIRRCKIPEVYRLNQLFSVADGRLDTLILDGLKIANTDILEKLLGKEKRW